MVYTFANHCDLIEPCCGLLMSGRGIRVGMASPSDDDEAVAAAVSQR